MNYIIFIYLYYLLYLNIYIIHHEFLKLNLYFLILLIKNNDR